MTRHYELVVNGAFTAARRDWCRARTCHREPGPWLQVPAENGGHFSRGEENGSGNRGRCCQLARGQLAAGDLVTAVRPGRSCLAGRVAGRGNAVMVKVTVPSPSWLMTGVSSRLPECPARCRGRIPGALAHRLAGRVARRGRCRAASRAGGHRRASLRFAPRGQRVRAAAPAVGGGGVRARPATTGSTAWDAGGAAGRPRRGEGASQRRTG